MKIPLPFPPAPRARANLSAGALYAIDGGDSFVYYGQVAANKQVGFFRFRSTVVSVSEALSAELMCRVGVSYPSIGQALRAGVWIGLGRHELRSELIEEPVLVQWPVGTLEVSLWKGPTVIGTTQVHDPEIQHLEIIAAFDATFHVPPRLRSEFTSAQDAWPGGGRVWQARRMKEELAARHPEQPWHKLPIGWVPVQ